MMKRNVRFPSSEVKSDERLEAVFMREILRSVAQDFYESTVAVPKGMCRAMTTVT
jgi:hypothetical protein